MRHAKRQEMAQKAAERKRAKRKRGYPVLRGVTAVVFVGLFGFSSYLAMVHPGTPLPNAWNPAAPLDILDPVTPITGWKLNRAAADIQSCTVALQGRASFQILGDFEESPQCHIRDRLSIGGVGQASFEKLETRCAVALRLAMWEQHTLQPAAMEHFGSRLAGINHLGSYSCRRMRTSGGFSSRMSSHATADAIDVSGFRFADGRLISLRSDWDEGGPAASFLRAARDGACDWFSLTLSPDYNALHADHFHLQSSGWGLCR